MKLFKYKYNPLKLGLTRQALFSCRQPSSIAFFFLDFNHIEETQD